MSIRTRLSLAISCLIIFFVALSLLLNSQYLGKYYISEKKASLLESKEMIENIYQHEPDSIALVLENLERNRGMNISILGKNNEMIYESSYRRFDYYIHRQSDRDRVDDIGRPNEKPPFMRQIEQQMKNLATDDYLITRTMDPRLKTEFLMLISKLKTGDILVLSSPLAAISESSAIANRFFMFTGLLTIFLGGIAVYLYANKFTKPILELNELAQGMSRLDFSKKYPVDSNDEVGQLGSSINSLSDQLDEAITELKEANAKLTEDIERERKLDKMRKEFVSNVSHELKTPIALIQGYAEGLKLNVNEDEENRNFYCEVIMDESAKMNRLVKDLLDLSQIESGYFKLERDDFDLSAMLDYLLEKYRPIFTEQAIKLEVEKPENILVNGDYVRIEQVLVNYLNNAINHIDDQKTIKISISSDSEKARVSIFNSGRHIPTESLDKIWTSFYKVDKARTRAYGGTGLGLSVVRSVLERHGSAFGAENITDGVSFWFEVDKAGFKLS